MDIIGQVIIRRFNLYQFFLMSQRNIGQVFIFCESTMWEHINSLTTQVQPHIDSVIKLAEKYQLVLQDKAYEFCPQMQNLNQFQIFLILNGVILGTFVLLRVLSWLNPVRMYARIVKMSFKLPFVANKIKVELMKSKEAFLESYPKKHRSQLRKIPYNVVEPQFGNECQMQSIKGHLSGSRYPDKKHSDFVVSLAKQFSYSNPLHYDLHPYLKQMQVEVIKMCAKMLNFYSDKDDVVGGFFSGGTQSILMAMVAYREYGFKHLGVTKPNLVICSTGHAAALKAADLFGLEVRIVKSDKNEQMHISDTKSKIDSNTVCVYTSYPNYPYGTVDPIDQIAAICRKRGIPVHVDMCLGGFIVPFLKDKEGNPIFVVPKGVTSISLDCHKYGLSAKGASVLLFSSEKYRREQLFVTSQWPGGLYGTVGIAGSRSGTMIASAWISMMRLGQKGYTKNAVLVSNAVKRLASELKILGFKVFGQPEICCIGFSHKKYSIGIIKQALKKKGWDIPIIQKPMALHYSFTPLNALKIQELVNSVKQTMAELQKLKPEEKTHKGSELQVYGVCSKIPDTSAKNAIMKMLLDAFLEI